MKRTARLVPAALTLCCAALLAFAACSLFSFFRGQTEPATDPARYPALLGRFPAHLTAQFPDKLPSDAALSYTPAVGQGGERLTVRFAVDDPDDFAASLSRAAAWCGTPGTADAASHGVFSGSLTDALDTVYVFYSQPSRPDDWNHGEISFAGVSSADSQVLYAAEIW